MKLLNRTEVLQELAHALQKPCMYINLEGAIELLAAGEGPVNIFGEIFEAAPYLDMEKHGQALGDEEAWLVFDTEEEMEDHYWRTVGDDGPTELNPYNGRARVYALTCGPDGRLRNENT